MSEKFLAMLFVIMLISCVFDVICKVYDKLAIKAELKKSGKKKREIFLKNH